MRTSGVSVLSLGLAVGTAAGGGAAGWCLHNGDERRKDDGKPRRSFNLRTQRLFDQFDEVEMEVPAGVLAVVAEASPRG